MERTRSMQFPGRGDCHARPSSQPGLDGKLMLVVQVFRHLGKKSGTQEIATLQAERSEAEKWKLVRDTRYGADWDI